MFFEEYRYLDYSIRESLNDIIPNGEMSEFCEMSDFESAVICGLIKRIKPKNILEVGVASGGTSAIILTALQTYKMNTQLFSLDISSRWYRKSASKPTGWQALVKYGQLPNWHLHTGQYLPEIIEDFHTNFDLCIIDTVHMLPGEVLDYLVAIKFMKLGAYILFHDTQLFHILLYYPRSYATKVLLDACVGNKLYMRNNTSPLAIPNISGFKINIDTYRYLNNCFSLLSMKWAYCIDERQFNIYLEFFKRYYPTNNISFFKYAYANNKMMIENSSSKTSN